MGSVGIAGWIATLAFPGLLIWGFFADEVGPKAIAVFVVLGAVAWMGLPAMRPGSAYLVTSALAVLDIVLVLMVFKGDIRLS